MKTCRGCVTCPFVKVGKTIKEKATNFTVDTNTAVDYNTKNVIYCIECIKPGCRKQYIGQTKDSLKHMFNQHRGYVNNKVLSKATGHHFNNIGHQISDLRVGIVEKVFSKCEFHKEIQFKASRHKQNDLKLIAFKKVFCYWHFFLAVKV